MKKNSKSAVRKNPPTKQLSGQDYRQLADVRYALRKFMEFSEKAAREAGLTSQQHQALLTIKGLSVVGNVSVGDVAKRLISHHNSTVELLDRLVDLGLVERRGDENDKRRINIVLTMRAERLLGELSDAHVAELKRLRPVLQMMLGFLE